MPEEDNNGGSGNLLTGDPFYDVIGGIVILLLTLQLIEVLPGMLSSIFTSVQGGVGSLGGVYSGLYVTAVGFSIASIAGAVYAGMQKHRIVVAEKQELKKLTRAAISGEETHNERWQQILSYAASDDHELWRLAIIEADVMMDEMLETMGYPQDSLGEKLRSAEKSDFQTIEQAWEAHKLRNTIAHEGSTYDLKRKEVDRAINHYRRVFNEFSYI